MKISRWFQTSLAKKTCPRRLRRLSLTIAPGGMKTLVVYLDFWKSTVCPPPKRTTGTPSRHWGLEDEIFFSKGVSEGISSFVRFVQFRFGVCLEYLCCCTHWHQFVGTQNARIRSATIQSDHWTAGATFWTTCHQEWTQSTFKILKLEANNFNINDSQIKTSLLNYALTGSTVPLGCQTLEPRSLLWLCLRPLRSQLRMDVILATNNHGEIGSLTTPFIWRIWKIAFHDTNHVSEIQVDHWSKIIIEATCICSSSFLFS